MTTFSVNQVNHLYVVKSVADTVDYTSETGTTVVKLTADNEAYVQHKGLGGITRSDLMRVKNIQWANLSAPKHSASRYKSFEIKIDETALKAALENADYKGNNLPVYLKFIFRGYLAPGDDDIHQEYVDLKNPLDNKQIAIDIFKAFHKNGVEPAIDVIEKGKRIRDVAEITGASPVTVAAAIPDWRLGVKSSKPANFHVEAIIGVDTFNTSLSKSTDPNGFTDFHPDGVSTFGNGSVTITRVADILEGNGRNIADLEWFFMGERADQYRGVNWPHNVETGYLVDPSKNYSVLQIHYAFTDTGVSVQQSEKDITLVAEVDGLEDYSPLLTEIAGKILEKADVELKKAPL